jgi:hypothetical protein
MTILTSAMRDQLEARKGLMRLAAPNDSDWTEGRELSHRRANQEAKTSLRMAGARLIRANTQS